MVNRVSFNAGLIARYDRSGPRYTSYPTAIQFQSGFSEADYCSAVARSHVEKVDAPLSLYVHLPFCSAPCYYCACTRLISRRPETAVDYFSRLDREIELRGALHNTQRVVEQLHLGGGTPTYLSMQQLAALMTKLDQCFALSEDESREYSIEIDPRTVHVDNMAELAGLGFNRLSLGVQDFSPVVQRAINRVQSLKDCFDLIGAARAAGFRSVSVDLIYGLPMQTTVSFESTLDLVIAARPDRIAAFSYAHLPERFRTQRLIKPEQLPSPAAKLDLLRLTVEKLTRAGYIYIGMDHFALPEDELAVAQRDGRLHRNFQGYSTREGLDLVGLGLSAISKTADTYSQNAKKLEHYYQELDQGHLPIERGVRLTRDDIIRRDLIESLMCNGRVDIANLEMRYGLQFTDYFAAELGRLENLITDGLVRNDGTMIQLTPAGRMLVRTVAMCFDAYLTQSTTKLPYSKVV